MSSNNKLFGFNVKYYADLRNSVKLLGLGYIIINPCDRVDGVLPLAFCGLA